MLIRAILSLVLGAIAIAGVACVGTTDANEPGEAAIVASSFPLAEAVARVGGPDVAVTDLTPPGAEPHDLELTPEDLEAIASADLVVYVGGGFQPAVEEAALAEAADRGLDVLEGAELLPGTGGEVAGDPHVWLDPVRYADVVERIGEALAAADPGRATAIRERTAATVAELEALDEEMRTGLAECDRRLLVTSHAAFGYLAKAYDLRQAAIAGVSPEAEPDPDRLAELAALAEAEGVTTVFTEELVSPEVAEALAAEAGLDTAVLDPLESSTDVDVPPGDGYATAMRRNLEALRDGLGCR